MSSSPRTRLGRCLSALILAGCLLAPGLASGQGPVPLGQDLQVNTYTTSFQRAPAVSLDAAGNFVVVWESSGSSGNDNDSLSIQGQRFDALGAPAGGEFQVNTYTSMGQDEPSIGTDASGNFVVVWTSTGSPGDDFLSGSIQAQRFSAAGLPQGQQFQVNTYTTGLQKLSDIAVQSDGSFTVVWESTEGSDTDMENFSIEGQRFDSSGSPVGAQFQVNTYTTNSQRYPSIGSDAAGNFVVVWWSVGSSGDDDSLNSIQGQRFDSAGSPVGTEFQVNTYTTGSQTAPTVAVHSTGTFVVTWRSNGSAGSDTDGSSIQAQRFASTGAAVGDQFQVNTYTTSDQGRPSVATNGDGDFVVIWHSQHNDVSGFDVRGQWFDDLGTRLGTEIRLNTTSSAQFNSFRGVDLNDDGFVAVWQSYGSAGSDDDSYSVQTRRYGPPDLEAPPAPTVGVSPNPVLIDTVATLDVVASDATTGDIPITSIEYRIDAGPWFEMQPDDGDWNESTEQAEELLTFEAGGTFSVCARAFDLAGNESDPGCTDVEVIVPDPDVRLRAIEVNQVIQNWRNEVPLYQDKKTVVRVFFESTDASSPSSVRGLLHGSIGGLPLPGSPLSAPAPATVANDAAAFAIVDGPDADLDPDDDVLSFRGRLDNSLNYLLPASWIDQAGTVDLDFELTTPADQVLECAEPDGDADCGVSVEFVTIDRPIIEFFSTPYQRNEIRQIAVNATAGSYEFVSGDRRSDPVPWDGDTDVIEEAIEDALDSRDGRVVVEPGRWCSSTASGSFVTITILRGQSEVLQVDDSGLVGSATMQLCEAGGPIIAPTDDDLREEARRLSDMFPGSGVDYRLRTMSRFKRAPTLLRVNTRLSKIRAVDRILGNLAPKSFALLLERGPTSTRSGMAWLEVSSTYSRFSESPTDGGSRRSVGAHEGAHTYGRAHAVVADQGPLGSVGLCGSKYLDPASPLHPFVEETGIENELAAAIDESIRFTWPTIGPLSSGPDDEIWGFSPRAFANGPGYEHLVVVDPRKSAELMSYCDPPGAQQDLWVSSFTYEKLANRIGRRIRSESGRGLSATQEFFLVAGSIDDVTGEVELEPVTRISGDDPGFEPGDVHVALVDELGNEVASRDVALLRDGDHPSLSYGLGPEPTAFFAAVPAFGGLFEPAGVVVTLDNEEIARVTASTHPPTVAITSPTSGSTATGVIPIAWTAGDLDGDPLTASIFYSIDLGTSWKALAIDVEDDTYDAPTEYLEGSDTAMIRVLVSDGFHTAQATSDPFEIDAGSPTASIEVPADRVAIGPGGLLQLRGGAWDPEDGELGGSALTWSMTSITDPSGLLRGAASLGEGGALDLPISGFSTGCHLITLTATDSDGRTDLDTIGVDLGATGCFDLLFADGFETGGVGQWSSSMP